MAKEIQKMSTAAFAAQERDADLIKQTFKDGERLLKDVRTLLVGGELLADQKTHIRSVFADANLRDLMRRRFLPSITDDSDMALGVVRDIWIGAEQMIFGESKDVIEQAMRYKEKSIDHTRKGLALLADPDGEKVPLKVLPYDEDPLQIELIARNMYIRHVDEQLSYLWLIANQKEETKKETETKRIRNSTR